jgi:hypothetical protein
MTEPTDVTDEIDKYRHHITPGMTPGDFAQLLPEHLRRPYWEAWLDEWFTADD